MSYYNVYNATSGRPAITITLIRTRTAARRPLTRTTFDSSYTSPRLSAIDNRSADSPQISRRAVCGGQPLADCERKLSTITVYGKRRKRRPIRVQHHSTGSGFPVCLLDNIAATRPSYLSTVWRRH